MCILCLICLPVVIVWGVPQIYEAFVCCSVLLHRVVHSRCLVWVGFGLAHYFVPHRPKSSPNLISLSSLLYHYHLYRSWEKWNHHLHFESLQTGSHMSAFSTQWQ